MRKSAWTWILLGLVILCVCCAVVIAGIAGWRLLNPQVASNAPLVTFHQPLQGGLYASGEEVPVHIVARGGDKLSRVELWINGRLVENETSPLPGGISPLALVTGWIPPDEGTYTLTAQAVNQNGEMSIGEITITVSETTASAGSDSDADGITDAADTCPAIPGLEPAGCPPDLPDADGDGIEDTLDECPDEAGRFLSEGCPDRDGDGVMDAMDDCPDEVGAPGSPAGPGCPSTSDEDRDGDGVVDLTDACPEEPGVEDMAGCPGDAAAPTGGEDGGVAPLDRDGDGFPDDEDVCPGEPGIADGGCPDDSPDRDGDGVPDSADACPDDVGSPEDMGCPIPEGIEEDPPPGLIEEVTGYLFPFPGSRVVEFQALSFDVNQDYDEVYCYASLSQNPPDLYGPFHFNGERSWDVTEYMGSMQVVVSSGDTLPVFVSCFGYSGLPGASEYHSIGQYVIQHPSSDWDDHVITARAEAIDYPPGSAQADVEGFEATYRICENACDPSMLLPPVLGMRDDPLMGRILFWSWDGDRALIDQFRIYVNQTYWRSLPDSYEGRSISTLEPECGQVISFYMTVAAGEAESPPSNEVEWAGPPCSQRVRITFDRISIYNVRDGVRNGEVGPVSGRLYATGSLPFELAFDGDDFPYGVVLNADGSTSVSALFRTIRNLQENEGICSGSSCHHYSAPEVSFIEMDLTAGTDLTVGVRIRDGDVGDDDILIQDEFTFPYEEIIPGQYYLSDGNVEVSYWINTIVTEDAGGAAGTGPQPDLQVTRVEKEASSGQIRALVVNSGAPITNQSFHLSYLTREGGSVILDEEYQNITLATDEGRWLQSPRTDIQMSNVIAFIDSSYQVEEANEDNNQYITPPTYRVSLEKILNQTFCENFLQQNVEFVYFYSVGYGPDADHISWVAHRLRYPPSGYLRVDRDTPLEELYIYPARMEAEFNVRVTPRDGDSIFILLTGSEHDPGISDSLGTIFKEYPPEQYQSGAIEDNLATQGVSEDSCGDAHPLGPPASIIAWFKIEAIP